MRGRRVLLLLSSVALLAGLLVHAAPAHAATVPVTLNITRMVAIEDPDPSPGQGSADFKANVTIDGTAFPTSSEKTDQSSPEPLDWVFSKNVDDGSLITITIDILDDDNPPAAPDDVIDINPVDNKQTLVIMFDPLTGDWFFENSDVPAGRTQASGDGDTAHFSGPTEGGEAATINFELSNKSASGDADGDGLLDSWETKGLDADGDGNVDVDLPAMGAKFDHKDLFMEHDIETGFTVTRESIQAMKAGFRAAPLTNPDGVNGVNLHVDTGAIVDPTADEGAVPNCTDGIDNGGVNGVDGGCAYPDGSVEDPSAANTCTDGVNNDGDALIDAADPDCLVGDNLGGGSFIAAVGACGLDNAYFNAKSANFNQNRRWIFRYSISAALPPVPGTCAKATGGQGEIGGNDFIEFNSDGGTIMHEFGHNLNLHHGGQEDNNCKPNYLSLMNYDSQGGIRRVGGGRMLDYSPPRVAFNGSSRAAAPLSTIVENDLDDGVLLDSTDGSNRTLYVNGVGAKTQQTMNVGVNWQSDTNPNQTNQSFNIDTVGLDGNPAACANGSNNDSLEGATDWPSVSLPFRQFGDSASGGINVEEQVHAPMTTAQLQSLEQSVNTTDVSVDVTDSPDAVKAGEQLTYTVLVKNNGSNPASSVKLVDTLPSDAHFASATAPCTHASGVVTCFLGDMEAGTQKTITITTDVPSDVAHNNGGPKTISNTATVDNLNGTDSNTGNDSDTDTTQVVAVADLSVDSFTALTPPGQLLLGQDTAFNLRTTISNGGPSSPMDAKTTATATVPAGLTATPNPQTLNKTVVKGTSQTFDQTFTVKCTTPGFKAFSFKQEIATNEPGASDPTSANNSKGVSFNLDCLVPVALNIRPGNSLNRIVPPESKGVPMAVLTTTAGQYGLPIAFDATKILANTTRWGREALVLSGAGQTEKDGKGQIQNSVEKAPISPNENLRDKDLDMVLDFTAKNSRLVKGDTKACVVGSFLGAGNVQFRFFGCDTVFVEKTQPGP